MTKEVRMKMSIAHAGKTHTEEARAKMSIAKTGPNHPMFCKTHTEEARAKMSGPNHSMFGKTLPEETRAKMSLAQTGPNNHMFGKTHTEEAHAKMSESKKGPNNPAAKPVCVFGKLYAAASVASDTLRDVCDTRSEGNFISEWARKPKHQHNVFRVSKEFYEYMKDTAEIITRDMYGQWSHLAVTRS
jgi:hypothetical protein